MNKRIALLSAIALVASVTASTAFAQAGKYCVIYKDGVRTNAPVVSTAKVEDCQKRSVSRGGNGFGLGCDVDGEVISSGNTPNESASMPDAKTWETADAKHGDACTKAWKPSD